MGLWHTFQEPHGSTSTCEAGLPGDFVSDTPVHTGPSSQIDCRDYIDSPVMDLPDTCTNLPGTDPIFNFLNYVYDEECWEKRGEFTCKQKERMYLHYKLYRERITTCEDGEMEIEASLTVGDDYAENSISIRGSDGRVYFNSVRDHLLAVQEYGATSFLVDMCVSTAKQYTLLITDTGANGFGDNTVLSVYINRKLVTFVEGNFGVVLSIPLYEDMPVLDGTVSEPIGLVELDDGEVVKNPSQLVVVEEEAVPTASPTLRPSSHPSAVTFPAFSPTSTPTTQSTTSPLARATASPSSRLSSKPKFSPTSFPTHSPTSATTEPITAARGNGRQPIVIETEPSKSKRGREWHPPVSMESKSKRKNVRGSDLFG